MSVIKMADLDLNGKRVLIREDLNVPVKAGKVTSDARIRAALPTIKLALEMGAKVMVMSHLGRPTEGEYDEEFSLAPVADYLNDALEQTVRLEKDYLNGVDIADNEVVVFENVRFNKGEKGIFVRKLLGFREKAKLQQVRQTYQEDGTFRDYVTRYLEEFEKLLDEASKRDPNSMLHATFLSSDMGKVYMVLARALDRDM